MMIPEQGSKCRDLQLPNAAPSYFKDKAASGSHAEASHKEDVDGDDDDEIEWE